MTFFAPGRERVTRQTIGRPFLALFGRDAMSDLSPESAPKRTSANAFEPPQKGGRGEVNSRAPQMSPHHLDFPFEIVADHPGLGRGHIQRLHGMQIGASVRLARWVRDRW